MLVLMVIGCIIFQTCIAIYLFNINKLGSSFDKNLNRIMVAIVGQMSTKFILLVILRDEMIYGRVASGFAFAHGALVYIVATGLTGRHISRKQSLRLLTPFFASSLIYIALVTAGFLQWVSINFVDNYTSVFQWFAVAFLLFYCTRAKRILFIFKASNSPVENNKVKIKLINNIATLLMAGVTAAILCEALPFIKLGIWDFQFRVLPYSCFIFIPVLILKHKLEQKNYKANVTDTSENTLVLSLASTSAPQVPTATPIVKRYEKSSLGDEDMDAYEVLLNNFVEKSKIYLNAELSLEELAQQVKIPKHHLTQLLNDRLKKNFYTYINECRIQEALRRLGNLKNEINILSLAYDCGFNSKSSFNNYFKKVTGCTPSAYRKMAETSNVQKIKIAS